MASGGGAKRQIELDFVRGIAILMVLHFHASPSNVFLFALPPQLPLINFGWAGVDLFFVLSGFLVGGLLCKEWMKTGRIDSVRFLKRRAFKIWPAYYALFFAYIITRKQPLNTFFWPNLLNIQNYIRTSISHSWSLAVEEHFYFAFCFAAWWCASRKVPAARFFRALLAAAFVVAAYRTTLALTGRGYFFQTHTRIDGFLLGVMLAMLFHFWPERFERLQSRRVLLSVTFAIAIVILFLDPQFSGNGAQILAADLGSAAFLLLLYRPRPQHGRLYRLVAGIGVYSYGIYLWHSSATTGVRVILSRVGFTWLQYPLGVIAAILFGAAMTRLIEFPFLRLREIVVPGIPNVNPAVSAHESEPLPAASAATAAPAPKEPAATLRALGSAN